MNVKVRLGVFREVSKRRNQEATSGERRMHDNIFSLLYFVEKLLYLAAKALRLYGTCSGTSKKHLTQMITGLIVCKACHTVMNYVSGSITLLIAYQTTLKVFSVPDRAVMADKSTDMLVEAVSYFLVRARVLPRCEAIVQQISGWMASQPMPLTILLDGWTAKGSA